MHRSINLAGDSFTMQSFPTQQSLRDFYAPFGCDGVEVVLCGPVPDQVHGQVNGLHLIFYTSFIDFWRGDEAALLKEFGTPEVWQQFYEAKRGEELEVILRGQAETAKALGAKYMVFHMGDNRLEEFYTGRKKYTDRQVVEACCQFVDRALDGFSGPTLLLENMWSGGMTLEDPDLVRLALDSITYADRGLLLDTGHLMATRPGLKNEEEGLAYVHERLEKLGEDASAIRGMHLHCAAPTVSPFGTPPQGDFWQRFSRAYGHLNEVDPHRPCPQGIALARELGVEYLTYELSYGDLADWRQKLSAQTGVRL